MFAFTRNTRKRPGANITLAIALLCGTALGATVIEAPAQAQKKKKEAAADYSKGFIAAYTPFEQATSDENSDSAAAKSMVDGLVSAMETADDRFAGGGRIYNLGATTSDQALQLRGMELMLESGKVPADKLGTYNLTAYQLATATGNPEAARGYLTAMADMGYSFDATMADNSTKTIGPDDMQLMIAETYFGADQNAAGLDYIKQLVAKRDANGTAIPQNWITRGLSVAYEANDTQQALDFSNLYVTHFPSATSWGDAIAIQRNLFNYDNQETLDILRLAKRTDALREGRSYVDYIEAADSRRLPGEVSDVIAAGVSAGKISLSDPYVGEASEFANGRINADKADLPALEQDARKASSKATLVMSAGDVFLGYGQAAKAESLFELALTKPGVDTQRALTRLGIAQADQGKTDEAIATLAKVQGSRRPIADLWAVYARQKGTGAGSASVSGTTEVEASMN